MAANSSLMEAKRRKNTTIVRSMDIHSRVICGFNIRRLRKTRKRKKKLRRRRRRTLISP